jgi:protein involved in polysaccharide export with SLBB domain
MIRRTYYTQALLSFCLGAKCVTGFCSGTNLEGSGLGPASITVDGTNQPFLTETWDGHNLNLNSARRLSPNDVISMTVYQEDDLATKTVIDENGMIMLPLLGQIHIGGMTTEEAADRIRQLYNKDFLVNPRVNLIVEHFAERRFSVLGQVQHPGNFDFPQNESMNLLQAIAISGGYTRLGSPSKVDVRRMEGEISKIYHLDAREMAKDPSKTTFEILPGDIITIGEKNL